MRDLDNGVHPHTHLTSRDVKNAIELHGPCTACLEGKMNNPREPPSQTPPAEHIGESLHIDLKQLKMTCIGGYTQVIQSEDEKSGLFIPIPTVSKSVTALCEGLDQLINFYAQYGHRVRRITTDGENALKACKNYLAQRGIELRTTPAGLHEKRAERYIQTLNKRKAAILASLDYELPAVLEAEALIAAAAAMNRSSCTVSAPYSPIHLVTGKKPEIPEFYFGQVGVFKSPLKGQPNEWGIYIGTAGASGSHRAYFPFRRGIQSRRKFVPHPVVPKEWNFPPRIRKVQKDAPATAVSPPPGVNAPLNTVQPVHVPPPVVDDHDDEPPQQPQPAVQPDFDWQNLPDIPANSIVPVETLNLPPVPAMAQPPLPPAPGLPHPKGVPAPAAAPPPPVVAPPPPPPPPAVAVPAPPPPLPQPVQAQKGDRRRAAKAVAPPPRVTQPKPTPIDQTTTGRPQRAAAQKNKGWIDGRYDAFKSEPYDAFGEWFKEEPVDPLFQRIQLANYFSYYGDEGTATKLVTPFVDFITSSAYRVSIMTALKMEGRRAEVEQAIFDEIHNLENNHVVKAVKRKHVTPEMKKYTVPSFMFLKFKYKADGVFDKVKGRLVAVGCDQDPETIGETFAPTVNPISVKTQLQVTVSEQLFLSAYDIKGAFLLSEMKNRRDGEVIYISVPANVVRYWRKLYPKYTDAYVMEDGSMLFELQRYIYGLAESPNKFNELLDTHLKKLGFTQLKADRCSYHLDGKHSKILISVHVDDLLVSCATLKGQKWLEESLGKSFELVAQRGKVISYLGMTIEYDREKSKLQLSQEGMVKDLLKKYNCDGIKKPPKTPAIQSIFDDPSTLSNNPLVDRKKFLSFIMSLMFIARFTRHDILFPTTILATRSSSPRQSDWSHAMRIARYLSSNTKAGPVFDASKPMRSVIYADASHGVHPTGHGHGAIIITLGSAPIHCQSFKLKLATRSSSESELVVLEEASTYAVWLRLLLKEMGVECFKAPVKVYQDNLSTMMIAAAGEGNFKRTKHLLARESFVKERIENGDIVLKHLGTDKMSADFLTKPLSLPKLLRHMRHLQLWM